jgi:hypothetical protein
MGDMYNAISEQKISGSKETKDKVSSNFYKMSKVTE